MRFSIKQKQVLGVTAIVAAVVVALSLQHVMDLTRVLLEESRERAQLMANAIGHQAAQVVTNQDDAYQEIRTSASMRAALEAAIYSEDVTDAVIVDPTGTIVAANDRDRIGQTVEPREPLSQLLSANGLQQLRAVYSEGHTLEWTQRLELADRPFGEVRIGVSTILVRLGLNRSLAPALLAAGVALLLSILVAMLLAQIVLRPIHVIQSGLVRLGRGELGAPLDLRDEEFKDLGDIFDRVSKQLRAAGTGRVTPGQLAESANRIASIGPHFRGVAHELKNPLNAMTIHLQLLTQKLSGSPELSPHLQTLEQGIKRLDERIQALIQYVQTDPVSFGQVRIAGVVSSMLDIVQAEADRAGVAIERGCGDDRLAVNGDATQLREAFLNLARNAIQAMPNGGRLSISCAAAPDDRIVVRVSDTGVGIAPENLARVFDLYFTTKEKGTGIGLTEVYRTISIHNGSIDVESTVGRGTTFTVTLPELQSR
jgi:signal transduction histidine kinase